MRFVRNVSKSVKERVLAEPLATAALLVSLTTLVWTLYSNATIWAAGDLRYLIDEEARAVAENRIDDAIALYTPNADIIEMGNENAPVHRPIKCWAGTEAIAKRYKEEVPRYEWLVHTDIRIEEVSPLSGYARARSSTIGVMDWPGPPIVPTEVVNIDGNVWEFEKIRSHWWWPFRHWRIRKFVYDIRGR